MKMYVFRETHPLPVSDENLALLTGVTVMNKLNTSSEVILVNHTDLRIF